MQNKSGISRITFHPEEDISNQWNYREVKPKRTFWQKLRGIDERKLWYWTWFKKDKVDDRFYEYSKQLPSWVTDQCKIEGQIIIQKPAVVIEYRDGYRYLGRFERFQFESNEKAVRFYNDLADKLDKAFIDIDPNKFQ